MLRVSGEVCPGCCATGSGDFCKFYSYLSAYFIFMCTVGLGLGKGFAPRWPQDYDQRTLHNKRHSYCDERHSLPSDRHTHA